MKKEVVIYTFDTCPYCIRAKRLLNNKGVNFKEIDITNRREVLSELKEKTDCSTVPQVFVNDKFIGGCDDIVGLHKRGEFDDIFLK
ncbi:glutaredoxin 3 [Wukongibacter baidiensis]|uniref:glutaredoxin 3 n=1 Tax=Wukongibacter baidiensis TaxID=1723361 RepID=UPI003D7F4376